MKFKTNKGLLINLTERYRQQMPIITVLQLLHFKNYLPFTTKRYDNTLLEP